MTLHASTLQIVRCSACGSALRHQRWQAFEPIPLWTDGCTARSGRTRPMVMACGGCRAWLEVDALTPIERAVAPRLGEPPSAAAHRHREAVMQSAQVWPSLEPADPAALARDIAALGLPPEDEARWRLQVWHSFNDDHRPRMAAQSMRIAGVVHRPHRRAVQGLERDNLERLVALTLAHAEPAEPFPLLPRELALQLGHWDDRLPLADMLRQLGRHGAALALLHTLRHALHHDTPALDPSLDPWARVIEQLALVGDTRVRSLSDGPMRRPDKLSQYLDSL